MSGGCCLGWRDQVEECGVGGGSEACDGANIFFTGRHWVVNLRFPSARHRSATTFGQDRVTVLVLYASFLGSHCSVYYSELALLDST